MTFAFGDCTVTTWSDDSEGQQMWRAHAGDRTVEFTADRQMDPGRLHCLAVVLLDLPLGPNDLDYLDRGPRIGSLVPGRARPDAS